MEELQPQDFQQWNHQFHWNHQFQGNASHANVNQGNQQFIICGICGVVGHNTDQCPLVVGTQKGVNQEHPQQQWNQQFQGNPQFQPYNSNQLSSQYYQPQFPPTQDFNPYQNQQNQDYQHQYQAYNQPQPNDPNQQQFSNYYQEHEYEQYSYEQYPQHQHQPSEPSLNNLQDILTTLLHDQLKMQAQLQDLITSQKNGEQHDMLTSPTFEVVPPRNRF